MKCHVILTGVAIAACCTFVAVWASRSSLQRGAPNSVEAQTVAGFQNQPRAANGAPSIRTVRERREILSLTSEDECAALERALASDDADSREFALTNLLPALVASDPIAAGRFAETNTVSEIHDSVLERVARLLAEKDPTNALAWAAELERFGDRETALTGICLKWAEADPAQAAASRERFIAEWQSFDALEDLTWKWAEQDFTAALDWVLSHPEDARRDQLIGRVAYLEAQTSPEAAARLVVDAMTPGESQIEAAISVLHQWAKQDLAAATDWAERFPLGPLRDRALHELTTIGGLQP